MDTRLQNALDAINRAVAGLSDEQLSWHLPGKWCAAEILEHLSLAFGGTCKGLQRVIQSGRPEARIPNWKERMNIFVVTEVGYFPRGRKAPPMVVPTGIAPQAAVSGIRENLTQMDALFVECVKLFGNRVRIMNHPVLGPLTITQWKSFHAVHTRHHMKQIQAMRTCMSAEVPSSTTAA